VPVQIEDLEEAPVLCLLDSGATSNRISAELAEVSGVSAIPGRSRSGCSDWRASSDISA
jgi:hypothetical protein